MSDFGEIEAVAGALLRQLAPAAQRQLLRRMVRTIRASQSARIGRQHAPDGTPYTPRKNQPTGKLRRQGALRRGAMFKKLRSARILRASVGDAEAWIGFTGAASRIARIHQDGGVDRPNPNARPMAYPRRELLGLTDAEQAKALDMLLEAVASLR